MSKNTNTPKQDDVQPKKQDKAQAKKATDPKVKPEPVTEAEIVEELEQNLPPEAKEAGEGFIKAFIGGLPKMTVLKGAMGVNARMAPEVAGDQIAHAFVRAIQVTLVKSLPEDNAIRMFLSGKVGQAIIYGLLSQSTVMLANTLADKAHPGFQYIANGASRNSMNKTLDILGVVEALKEKLPLLNVLFTIDPTDPESIMALDAAKPGEAS